MSRYNARIEEVSDSSSGEESDPMEMDIDDFNPSSFSKTQAAQKAALSKAAQQASVITPRNIPPPAGGGGQHGPYKTINDTEKYKHFQCVYPVYFDAGRSRADGRRVEKSQAVPNPLARDIADACGALGLNVVFEPMKLHPKDWANPGRIRVLIKEEGKMVNPIVKNSKHDPTEERKRLLLM
jgi:signal recognition particle subunit SRP19